MVRVAADIELVPMHAGFVDAIAEHARRDHDRMARWLAWVHDGGGAADAIRAYIMSVEDRREHDLGDNYAILVSGELAGTVDIHDVSRLHGLAAVGYWLGSAYGGRGIMTRAVRTTAELAFTRHRINRLELLAAVGNAPSRAVAERAGFTLEAILRDRLWSPDGYDDAALYVRFAAERNSANGA
jgi:ribosomal-protein-serine acetyltransferase